MVLIAYASKTGTTAECAAQLAALLPGASLCDLTKETPEIGRFAGAMEYITYDRVFGENYTG